MSGNGNTARTGMEGEAGVGDGENDQVAPASRLIESSEDLLLPPPPLVPNILLLHECCPGTRLCTRRSRTSELERLAGCSEQEARATKRGGGRKPPPLLALLVLLSG